MISVPVTETSQVADARRRLAAICQQIGFDEVASGRAAIVATELATNLVKYGQAGEMLLGTYEDETGAGVQVVAIDKGTGLVNIDDALRDGHSTGGSAGEGLGAVRRQSQAFDVASWPGRGTAVLARLEAHPTPSTGIPLFGGVDVPMRGEVVCGDAFGTYRDGSGWTVMVADGLGHGPNAAQASQEAVRLFRRYQGGSPAEVLAAMHAGMKHTRGGAVSIARYDGAGRLDFAGIGNVAGAIVSRGEIKRTVSMPGTVGHVMRRVQSFAYPFPPGSRLVLCSDGIGTTWSLDGYPGLVEAHPSLVAAIVYRDFARGRDDATVLVAGEGRS